MDSAELLERAHHYRMMATRVTDEQTKEGLLVLAEQYEALATEQEDPLAQAQRHVREFERRLAEQVDRVARMKADGDSERGIASAEAVLTTMRRSLELAREHLAFEQQQRAVPKQ
jgi:hypothetical protein